MTSRHNTPLKCDGLPFEYYEILMTSMCRIVPGFWLSPPVLRTLDMAHLVTDVYYTS